jgi:hypothetical protein
VTGGSAGVGRRCRANVETKTAPTPICPWLGGMQNLVENHLTYRTYYVRVELANTAKPGVINPTKVSRKKSLAPRGYLWYPLVQCQNRRNPPQNHNSAGQHSQPPWCYAKIIDREGIKWDPCPNVHKAGAVENQVDDRGKNFSFRMRIEIPIP